MATEHQIDDAIALVAWFESLPDRATELKDDAIAERLRWFVGGGQGPKNSREFRKRSYNGPKPDVGRVRRTRRFVDRDDSPLFADYWFGLRKIGGGVSFCRLSRRGEPDDGTDRDMAEVAYVTQQQDDKRNSEVARLVGKWGELKEENLRAGAADKAIACSHAESDLLNFGRFTDRTRLMLVDLGLIEVAP